MRTLFFLQLLLITSIAFSQIERQITLGQIDEWEKQLKTAPDSKAKINAISNNDLKSLSLNREQLANLDFYFKYKAEVVGITDQKKTGRCWMFTGLNIIRPKVIKKLNVSSFEFSTNYLFFYDMLEKANLALEIAIESAAKPLDDKTVEWLLKNPIGDGGVFTSLINLIEKYGVVPKEIMPETYHSENTSQLNNILSYKIREDIIEIRNISIQKQNPQAKMRERKNEMLGEIYKILTYHLGTPPKEFVWRYKTKDDKISELKTYTPKSFLKDIVPDFDTKQYVQIMNDPSRPYFKTYEIEYDRNTIEGMNWVYLNLPIEEVKKIALKSIKANEVMYFSCDVGKQLNMDKGLLSTLNYDYSSLYGISFNMDKKSRIQTFESGSSHGMALVGVDTDNNDKPLKWLVENSWGASSGFNGYLVITDDWFNEYMFRLAVKKEFLDTKTLDLFKLSPIKLPPWDPMFQQDE
ncbi:MAG TPA: C1 family peptidase [Bacteroidales bacterium]|nr:C1 family peptidase [Bacteroidales bacterium]